MHKFTLLLLSLVLLAPLGIDLYLPVLPQIASELDTPVGIVQTTIPLFMLIMGLGQLLTGPLADNFGRKPMALIGLLLYLTGSAVAASASQWSLFFLARVIQGCAVCFTAVVAFSGVRDRMNGSDAARAYGFLNGALNIVPALAPLLGGIMAGVWGWRAPFWFLTGYAAVLMLVVTLCLPETRPSDTLRVAGLPLRQYLAILRRPRFLAFALANAGALGMILTYVSLAPEVLMVKGGLTPIQFSVAFGLNGFWIMLVSAFAGQLIHKAGRPICLGLGFISLLTGALMLGAGEWLLPESWQNHWTLYMLPVAVASAGLAFTVGPATSYALEPYQQQAGVASALQGFLQMAGGASASLLIVALPLAEKSALSLMMMLGAVLALVAWQYSRRIRGRIYAI